MTKCLFTAGVCIYCGNADVLLEDCPALRGVSQGDEAVRTAAQDDRDSSGASHVPLDLTRADAPSFLQKVKNFTIATARHVAAGMPMASDDEILRRHDICLTCEHLQNDACNLCGCPVVRAAGYVSKLSWADQECPAGKWGRADDPPSA